MKYDITDIYDEMRPYNDAELLEAMNRVVEQPELQKVLKYLFPNRPVQESIQALKSIKTIQEFQQRFSSLAVKSVIEQTTTEFTYSGFENLKSDASYLFISNHRDIVMDSAFMQYILNEHKHRTSQITFGSNLMSSQFIVDLGKMNKMFTFYRSKSRVDIYRNALIHSVYIKKVLTELHESAWIAQRDGRTKDGDDKTQVSLLKMLTIKEKDHVESLQHFNIVPISISYEYEPCDIFKVRELALSKDKGYQKEKDEDFISVMTGILSPKGKVHVAFGKPVNSFIQSHQAELNNDNVHESVCMFMDEEIHKNYQLSAFNYAAYDVLNMSRKNLGEHYQQEDLDKLLDNIDQKVKGVADVNEQILKDGLIQMYANPVINRLKY